MPGLMSGDWKRGTVSGPQRLQPDAWTAPDLAATAPAPDSTTGVLDRSGLYGVLAEVEALGLDLIEIRRLHTKECQ
jgi:hypothetical protein